MSRVTIEDVKVTAQILGVEYLDVLFRMSGEVEEATTKDTNNGAEINTNIPNDFSFEDTVLSGFATDYSSYIASLRRSSVFFSALPEGSGIPVVNVSSNGSNSDNQQQKGSGSSGNDGTSGDDDDDANSGPFDLSVWEVVATIGFLFLVAVLGLMVYRRYVAEDDGDEYSNDDSGSRVRRSFDHERSYSSSDSYR